MEYSDSVSEEEAAFSHSSGRNKRRRDLADRLSSLNASFVLHRDIHYRTLLNHLQTDISTLHDGTNPAFTDTVGDLEEERDGGLQQLKLYRDFLIDRAGREYERECEAAEEEYKQLTSSLKERLLTRWTAQKKRLREDKEMIDVANDSSMLLHPGSYSLMPSSPERRRLRKRGEDVVSVGSATSTLLNGKPRRKRREEGGGWWSDREKEREPGRAFAAVSSLREADAQDDLLLLRRKRRR